MAAATTLITGTGFLGAYVARDLLCAGERVVCMSRSPSRGLIASVIPEGRLGQLELLAGDVADLPGLLRIVKTRGVERIVHLAGLLYHPSEENPPLADRVQVGGTLNVFETALALGVRKIVWASSMSVYGARSRGADGYIADDSPPDPDSVYGACKALCERLAVNYADRHGLDITGLRLSSLYGYGKQETVARGSGLTWLDQLIDRPARGEGPNAVPCGDGKLDFLYVEDAARLVTLSLAVSTPGGPSYLTAGDFRPVREAFGYVRSLLPDADMTLEPGGSLLAPQSGPYRAEAITRDVGWAPEHTMEAGILKTIETIRARQGLPPIRSEAIR